MKCLNKGQDYSELKKSYIIFICTFDPFEAERYIYTFENVCLEDSSQQLKDETIKVFVNTKGKNGEVSDYFRELMHFLDTSEMKKYNNPLVNDMAKALEKARTKEEWGKEYMSIEMLKRDAREEGRVEGRVEGRDYQALQTARNMHAAGMDNSLIAKMIGYTESVVAGWFEQSPARS